MLVQPMQIVLRVELFVIQDFIKVVTNVRPARDIQIQLVRLLRPTLVIGVFTKLMVLVMPVQQMQLVPVEQLLSAVMQTFIRKTELVRLVRQAKQQRVKLAKLLPQHVKPSII